jgi:hypothetical protein
VMVVIGGLQQQQHAGAARMCAPRVTTYYIDSPTCVDGSTIPPSSGRHARRGDYRALAARRTVRHRHYRGARRPTASVGETIDESLALRGPDGRGFDSGRPHLRKFPPSPRPGGQADTRYDWDPTDRN